MVSMSIVWTMWKTCGSMEALLELTPGTGWLAREHDRILYLPNPETVDVAHDVIEPLLVARSDEDAFALLADWIETERPLPLVVLLSLGRPMRMMGFGVHAIDAIDPAGDPASVPLGPSGTATEVGPVRSISLHDDDELASGMLVEGVVRAGSFRLHLHHSPEEPGHLAAGSSSQEPAVGPRLQIDDYTVDIGAGVVLGRWPYKHQSFTGELEPIIVADPAVSRLHAEVRVRGDDLVVTDRSSHNGTMVVVGDSGRRFRLEPDVAFPVVAGDRILMGETVITVV